MVFVRHVEVTLLRAINVNACTGFLKARTIVTAKASYKNLAYTTSPVVDLGKNPVWEKDGTSVFHFEFGDDSSEFITLELFNRNKDSIGVSKLYFSELGHLPPGDSETKTLPVMVSSNKQAGELILKAEILEQQAMGERGLLTMEIRKGHMIQKIVSIFGSRTTKIKAKLTYKHTTFTSGVLEDMGNRFIWHEDNVFTFIVNTDLNTESDTLKIEVYKVDNKVGECEMPMSLFVEENRRELSNEFVAHTADLYNSNRSRVVGNIEVRSCFTPKPVRSRRRSLPRTQQHHSSYVHNSGPQVNQSAPFMNSWASVPPREERFYPPPREEFYPPVYPSGAQAHIPSAPVMRDPHNQAWSQRAPGTSEYQQPGDDAVGAPPGPSLQDYLDEEMRDFTGCFH